MAPQLLPLDLGKDRTNATKWRKELQLFNTTNEGELHGVVIVVMIYGSWAGG